MDNIVDRICKRFLGIGITGSIYDKRRICIQLIRTIIEQYNIEAYKRLEPTLSIGDLSSVNGINIDIVYKTIIELCNNYNGICNRRIPKIARNVIFEERYYLGDPYPTWSDGKYEYIEKFNAYGHRVINAMATPAFIEMRTNEEQKTITLLDEDAPYEYLVMVSGEVIVVNSLENCFDAWFLLEETPLANEDYMFIVNANWNVSNVTDMSSMFYSCTSLTTINGLNNWNVSNVTNMSSMFDYCTSLADITALENWNVSNVNDMSAMFDYCTSLADITSLENWNVSNVTDIWGMFFYCTSLNDITSLSNWNVSNVTNMSAMFGECVTLANITALSNWDVSNVTDMNHMFFYCTSLNDITALEKWNVSNVNDMSAMFGECVTLANITALSNWDVSNVTNVYCMFHNCTSLNDITALSNWNVSNVTDIAYMFYHCTSLPQQINSATTTEAVKEYLNNLKNSQ